MKIKWQNVIILLLVLVIFNQHFQLEHWKTRHFNLWNENLDKQDQIKDYQNLLEERDYTIEALKEQATLLKEIRSIRDTTEFISRVYRVDKYLLEAIIIHETGNYTSKLYKNNNNVCGMRYENSYEFVSYVNVEQSIISCARNLKFNYLDMGYLSIKSIGSKYAPINDTSDTKGLNNHWVEAVTRIYNKLKGGK